MTSLFPPLPVFLDLTGRAVVLLAADEATADLARRLLDAGAGVTVIAPEPSEAMRALSPSIRLVARRWRSADLAGATLVAAPRSEARRARQAARAARALFLAPGEPGLSDILLGSAVAHGPLALGVSAAGAAPAVGEVIARRIEAAVPAGFGGFLEAAARLAAEAETVLPDPAARDSFWREAAEAAFDHARGGGAEEWESWIASRFPHV